MLDLIVGIIGSIVLVVASARPSRSKQPIHSTKNWLLAIWALIMLIYSFMFYLHWWTIFFFILELLLVLASILMMLDTDDKLDTILLSIAWIGLVIWSLFIFSWYTTLIFIFWLIILSFGYVLDSQSIYRDLSLTIGSLLIVIFSYLEPNRIFFFLNLFFAIFSWYYFFLNLKKHMLDNSPNK